MKKYRLIKNYPGCSWTLNSICSNDFIWDNGKKVYLKNYPEFWEEVIEKDYKILSFKHKVSNHIWKNDSQLKDTFCIVDGKAPFTSLEEINKYPKVYEIHSIKRLSDGEIFTINDRIKVFCGYSFIKKFNINNLNVLICTSKTGEGFNIENLEHIKKPLFTTEDGVDIFENDEVWGITKNVWKPFYRNAKLNNKIVTETWFHGKFSTKEKAEEYILMNKPCLSINDFLSVSYFTVKSKTRTIKRLKKLINSKL